MKIAFSIVFVWLVININAQTSLFVTPFSTNSNYAVDQDSSLVSYDANVLNGKLVLFLGGTNSNTENYAALKNKIVDLGYNFINLSYPNTVAAASLSSSENLFAFDQYRQEICYGTPISDAVSVDSLNSIHSRFLNLLNFLNSNFPAHNWNNYLNSSTTINWENIIVAGHSQGSGHAAFIAKSYSVERVLMFSGLNDYSDFYSGPGNWLSSNGVTPAYKFYAYLSLLDEAVDYEKQFANVTALGVSNDSIHVDNMDSPFNNSHNLYTTQSPGFVILNHSSPVKFSLKNHDVWTYMLSSNTTNKIKSNELPLFSIYPNPTSETIKFNYSESILNMKFSIHNLEGKLVKSGLILTNEIKVKDLKPGTYILAINNGLIKKFIVK